MGAKAAALAGVQRLKEEMHGYVQKNEELNAHVKELNSQILEMTGKLENEEKERRRLEQSGPARTCKPLEKKVERQQHMIMELEEELERWIWTAMMMVRRTSSLKGWNWTRSIHQYIRACGENGLLTT